VKVWINGEERDLPKGATVLDAAMVAGADPGRGVAIAVDGEVVPRADLGLTELREGQRVEVVTAIGGGWL
jgi:sulfur carrier protein